MKLETTRLIIRNFVVDDLTDLHEILGDAEVMKYCEPPYNLKQTEHFLNTFCIARRGALAAVQKNSKKVIGSILFNKIADQEYEMGWFFNRKIWGNGYAFEACKAVVDYAIGACKAKRIFSETIDPVKSVGLMKKLGMKLEGAEEIQTSLIDSGRAMLYTYALHPINCQLT